MFDPILIVASVVTALTAITTFLFKIYNFFRKLEIKYDEMNALLKNNTIHLLKIAVLDDKLPLTDRIHAGEQYIKLGGKIRSLADIENFFESSSSILFLGETWKYSELKEIKTHMDCVINEIVEWKQKTEKAIQNASDQIELYRINI